MKIVAVILVFALTACSTDQQRTRTEGTVLGVFLGALAGGAAGALIGLATGNGNNVGEYAAAGAGAGAAIGGVAGYNWGKNVARKKEQYANAENYLDGTSESRSSR